MSRDASLVTLTEDESGVIAVQKAIKFNGGGHINHSIFWNNLSPQGGGTPTGSYHMTSRDTAYHSGVCDCVCVQVILWRQ